MGIQGKIGIILVCITTKIPKNRRRWNCIQFGNGYETAWRFRPILIHWPWTVKNKTRSMNFFSSKSVLFHVSHGSEGCLDGDIWGYKRLKFSKTSTAFGGGNHYTFINGFWATARGHYGEYCPPYHLSYLSLNAQHMLLFAKKKKKKKKKNLNFEGKRLNFKSLKIF